MKRSYGKAIKSAFFWKAIRAMVWKTPEEYVSGFTKEAGLKPAWVLFGNRKVLL